MKLYRYSSLGGSKPSVYLDSFEVRKETAKSWRLDNGRLVLKGATKKWACPSVEEARVSFFYRKRKHLQLLKIHVQHVEKVLEMLEKSQLPTEPFTFTHTEPSYETVDFDSIDFNHP